MRTTAAMILGVLVFYNTGSLFGLHAHADGVDGPIIHAHGAESSADLYQDLCQFKSERDSAATALLEDARPASHLDYTLLSDFILSAADHTNDLELTSAALIVTEAVFVPRKMPRFSIRIRDGTSPPLRVFTCLRASRAPPLAS